MLENSVAVPQSVKKKKKKKKKKMEAGRLDKL